MKDEYAVHRLDLEGAAYKAFIELMQEAEELRRKFRDAGLRIPEPLQRFFGGPPNK
jgi:hypothetical protein